MSSVFHLIYISRASQSLSYSDVQNILTTSKVNNAREGITGLLILRDDYFVQLLEGSEDAVKKLLGNIIMDQRNSSLKVLIETSSNERLFADWEMAFVDGDLSSNSTQELVDFFEACVDSGHKGKDLILPLLRKFRASAPALK
jgi:hypothetical protein